MEVVMAPQHTERVFETGGQQPRHGGTPFVYSSHPRAWRGAMSAVPDPSTPLADGDPSERETALLDAASRRFIAVGIDKTTMEDIAREAGAGKATLYRYFTNKAAVVDALVGRETQRFERHLRRAVAQASSPTRQVEDAFVAALDFLRSHPMLNKSLYEEPTVLLPYLTLRSGPIVQTGMTLFAEVIEAGIAAGEFRDIEPEWAAETLFRLVMSFFSLPPLAIRVDDPEQVRRYAHGLVAGGLSRRETT
jgi:AcrR family transcriptional regulator